jgi:thioredoxin reductase (NADPH)
MATKRTDVLVIGSGPAGLAAAVNSGAEGLRTIVLERPGERGGQARESSRIENYPGFAEGVTGAALTESTCSAAERFGVTFHEAEAIDLRPCADGGAWALCEAGDEFRGSAVVIASGVQYRTLDVPGAARLVGRGVYYGAGAEDAPRYAGRRVIVVGGANSAGQAALHFARHGAEVWLVIRGESLRRGMSAYLADRVEPMDGVRVLTRCRIAAVHGADSLEAVTLAGPDRPGRVDAAALYVFIGADPRTDWAGAVARDSRGFVLTGPDLPRGAWKLARHRHPAYLETDAPGVYAAGDVRAGSVKRIAAAVGEGAQSVQFIHTYLEGIDR